MNSIIKTTGIMALAALLANAAVAQSGSSSISGSGSNGGGNSGASSGSSNSNSGSATNPTTGNSGSSTSTTGTGTNPTTSTGSTGITGSTGTGSSSNWDTESNYWRDNYPSRPYYNQSRNYSTMEPAYRYGVDLYNRYPGRSYDELSQSELESGWGRARGNSTLDWNNAQAATRDAYNRLYDNRNTTRQ